MRNIVFICPLICIIFLFGCSSHLDHSKIVHKQTQSSKDRELIEKNYEVAKILDKKLNTYSMDAKLMLVSTFVNLDNLQSANSLGRLIPQQISSKLAQLDYRPLDIRLRHSDIEVKEKSGELALSRKLKDIALEQQASTILVGTYSVLYNKIYVTAKVLRCKDSTTLAAYDYTLSKSRISGITPTVITDYRK